MTATGKRAMDTVRLLTAARALIANPAHWSQGALARDGDGRGVPPRDPAAVCWCAMGALSKFAPLNSQTLAARYLEQAALEAGAPAPSPFTNHPGAHVNDAYGHAAVMAAYDRAIELAKEVEEGSASLDSGRTRRERTYLPHVRQRRRTAPRPC